MPPPGRSKRQDKQTRSRKAGNAPQQGEQASKSIHPAAPSLQTLPFELQQIILNTFNSAFPIVQDPEHLKQVTQEIKGHLFNRDFSAAFGQPSYLQAYALRWSAARALGYAQILSDSRRRGLLLLPHEPNLTGNEPMCERSSDPENPRLSAEVSTPDGSSSTKVVCIGGGAGAEVVGLVAAHRTLEIASPLRIVAVDSADWSEPVSKLSAALSTGPTLPALCSESFKARPENRPLVEDPAKVSVTFLHQDVLSWPVESLRETIRDASLCTIMFTLNELFSFSLPKTTALLLQVTDVMRKGSHLLVIDSPGSYSEINLGKGSSGTANDATTSPATRKYPMKWLLDHTLLEVAKHGEAKWVRLESEDSQWFRIEQKDRNRLKYTVDLENMRYQMHLYRRE